MQIEWSHTCCIMRILVKRHIFVRRLGELISSSEQYPDNFQIWECQVEIIGCGDLTEGMNE